MNLNKINIKLEHGRRPRRGFSLIEILVVMAIVGVVSGLSVVALEGLNKRASFAKESGSVVSALRRTQAEAAGRGVFTAFIIDTVGSRWWGIETTGNFSLSTFSPTSPGTVISSGTLSTGNTFGPAAGWNAALAVPFTLIPTLPAQAPAKPYCSFCLSSGFGSMLFEPGAPVAFSSSSSRFGEQFSINGRSGNTSRTVAVAIVARTGLIETFDKSP